MAELLKTSFQDFLLLYMDGFIDSHGGPATAGRHISVFDVNLPRRLNYCTTSTTAELCSSRLALPYLLHLPVPSKGAILTDIRAVISSVTNKSTDTLFVREVVDTCPPLKMLCGPYILSAFHFTLESENEADHHLSKGFYQDKESTIGIHRPVEARHLIPRILHLRHPDLALRLAFSLQLLRTRMCVALTRHI